MARRVIHRPLLGTRPDDEIIIDTVISSLHNPEGRFDGAISFNRDVTVTARLEAELATLGSLAVATERRALPGRNRRHRARGPVPRDRARTRGLVLLARRDLRGHRLSRPVGGD